jgi:hypothetical protein
MQLPVSAVINALSHKLTANNRLFQPQRRGEAEIAAEFFKVIKSRACIFILLNEAYPENTGVDRLATLIICYQQLFP